jgi:hypothetical protein
VLFEKITAIAAEHVELNQTTTDKK